MLVKDKIWDLASEGPEGMGKLYHYLISISRREILKSRKEGECGIQESL
jgi:hypothetical protein